MVWKTEDNGLPSIIITSFFIPSCDWVIWPHIERHISGESFTTLNVQFSDFCLHWIRVCKSVVKKWPEIWTFICNSKPIWNGQAGSWLLLVQVRLTSGPSPKAHWLSACRCSRSPWASYHLTKLFFWDCWVIMLISGCRLLMEGWVSVIMSAIYRSLDWYLDQSWNTLKV